MAIRTLRLFSFFFISFFLLTEFSYACMGVSRTINVSSFHPHLGTGGSGGIGLRHKEVVLTFDDGPVPGKTTRVLAALSNECLKATFFVVGSMARAYPKLLQRVARSGHTIAHHSQNHANLANTSIASAQRNIETGIRSVNIALGPYRSYSSKLFRYPYLARSASLDASLKSRGMLPLSAGVMSQDWKAGSGAGMVQRVMSRLNRTQRGIILLHDIQAKTASALPQLLRRLKSEGYKVVHIRAGGARPSQLLASNNSYRSNKKSANNKRTRQIVALKNTKPSTERRRWKLFSRRSNDSETIDKVKTASVKKTVKKSNTSVRKVKIKDAEDSPARKSLFARIAERRAKNLKAREEQAKLKSTKKIKTASLKKSTSNATASTRNSTKKNANLPAKRKSLFARIAERRAKNLKAREEKAKLKSTKKTKTKTKRLAAKKKTTSQTKKSKASKAAKKSWLSKRMADRRAKRLAAKKLAKINRKTTKRALARKTRTSKETNKTSAKRKFSLTRNLVRRKKGESDKAFKARRQKARLKLKRKLASLNRQAGRK